MTDNPQPEIEALQEELKYVLDQMLHWTDKYRIVKKERDQLKELVSYYESELIRERGYI